MPNCLSREDQRVGGGVGSWGAGRMRHSEKRGGRHYCLPWPFAWWQEAGGTRTDGKHAKLLPGPWVSLLLGGKTKPGGWQQPPWPGLTAQRPAAPRTPPLRPLLRTLPSGDGGSQAGWLRSPPFTEREGLVCLGPRRTSATVHPPGQATSAATRSRTISEHRPGHSCLSQGPGHANPLQPLPGSGRLVQG